MAEDDAQQKAAAAVIQRFLEEWGTPERGQRLWQAWQSVMDEGTQTLLGQLAEAEAEANGVTLEEAQSRLALEKFVQDRGPAYAAKFLRKMDAERFRDARSLQPMRPVGKNKKFGR